ncbi:hypothetical protein ABPG74_014662 [Tetrahymena malaccensis]
MKENQPNILKKKIFFQLTGQINKISSDNPPAHRRILEQKNEIIQQHNTHYLDKQTHTQQSKQDCANNNDLQQKLSKTSTRRIFDQIQFRQHEITLRNNETQKNIKNNYMYGPQSDRIQNGYATQSMSKRLLGVIKNASNQQSYQNQGDTQCNYDEEEDTLEEYNILLKQKQPPQKETYGLTESQQYFLWDQYINFNSVQKKYELQYYNYTLIPSQSDMEILKDIDRTIIFQGELISGKQKEKLKKILRAISHNSKDVGYVQGLNQIVGTLIPLNLKENEIYWIVLYFLKKLKLKEMYKEGFPRLKILTFQLEIFMQNYLPELLQYLKENNISVSYFCTKWFITLFSYDLENKTILKIWNLFLIKGWKVLIRIALALLKLFEKNIKSEHADNLSDYIRNFAEQNQKAVNDQELIKIAFSLKVTNRLLLSLQNIYEQHASYNFNVHNLNILLFQNYQLNNVYDWKILPQAPHFEGLNSILERLNAHTMVADYINELSSIQSQRRSQKKSKPQEMGFNQQLSQGVSLLNKIPHKKGHQRSLSSTRQTNMLLNQFDFPHTSVNDIRFRSNKKEQAIYESRSQSIPHATESDQKDEPGFLQLIQNKIISIFNNQDQQDYQRSQSKSRIDERETAYTMSIKPSYVRQSSTPQIFSRNQTQSKYYDQILEDYKELNDQNREDEDILNKNQQAKQIQMQQQQQQQQQLLKQQQQEQGLYKQTEQQKQLIHQQQQINQVFNTNMTDVNEFDYTYARPKQTFTKFMIMQKPANLDKIQQNLQFVPIQQTQGQQIQAQLIPTMKIQQMQQRQQQYQQQPVQQNQIKIISPSVSPDFRAKNSQMIQQRVFLPQQQQQIQSIQRIIPINSNGMMLINQKY